MTPPYARALAWFLLSAVLGTGCDLQTKAWAEQSLGALPTRTMMVFDPWLELSLVYNRGSSFSVLRDLGAGRWVFAAISLAVFVGLMVAVLRSPPSRLHAIALGVVGAGALGNGIDRLFRVGPNGWKGVVDFIKVNYPWGGNWPLFNVADALLVIGVGLLLVIGRSAPPAPSPKPAS